MIDLRCTRIMNTFTFFFFIRWLFFSPESGMRVGEEYQARIPDSCTPGRVLCSFPCVYIMCEKKKLKRWCLHFKTMCLVVRLKLCFTGPWKKKWSALDWSMLKLLRNYLVILFIFFNQPQTFIFFIFLVFSKPFTLSLASGQLC